MINICQNCGKTLIAQASAVIPSSCKNVNFTKLYLKVNNKMNDSLSFQTTNPRIFSAENRMIALLSYLNAQSFILAAFPKSGNYRILF